MNRSPAISEDFLGRLRRIFPAHYASQIERTFSARPTTFRCNTLKSDREAVIQKLQREGFTVKRLNWFRDGFILSNRSARELKKQSIFESGEIYLQSLASMVPALILDPKPGETILDMTASPGSKTSQIAAMMQRKGALVASELDKIRFERLAHNMRLLNVTQADEYLTLLQGDATKIFSDDKHCARFDRILLDAPCSAESRIVREDRRTFGSWSLENIQECSGMQRKLLDAAWPLLKPGGVLVYSTCTFAPEENELQVDSFLAKRSDAKLVPIADLPGLTLLPGIAAWGNNKMRPELRAAKRILPTESIEGFFVAKIQKYKL